MVILSTEGGGGMLLHPQLAVSLPALQWLQSIAGEVLPGHTTVAVVQCVLAGDVNFLDQKHLWCLCEEKRSATDPSNQVLKHQLQDGKILLAPCQGWMWR